MLFIFIHHLLDICQVLYLKQMENLVEPFSMESDQRIFY